VGHCSIGVHCKLLPGMLFAPFCGAMECTELLMRLRAPLVGLSSRVCKRKLNEPEHFANRLLGERDCFLANEFVV